MVQIMHGMINICNLLSNQLYEFDSSRSLVKKYAAL